MSYSIDSIDDWPSGDTRVFPFVVTDEDTNNDYLGISGADISWKLIDRIDDSVVLDDGDSNVDITITNATDGEFEVEVGKEATSDLEGRYREIIKIVDANGNRSKWQGTIRIEDID